MPEPQPPLSPQESDPSEPNAPVPQPAGSSKSATVPAVPDAATPGAPEIDPMELADALAPKAATSSEASSAATEAAISAPVDLAAMDDQAAMDELLKHANFEDPIAVTTLPPAPEASQFDLPNFQQVIQDAQVSSIDLLRDVELNVKIELGRSRMLVEDVLKLGEGSVVELDKLAGDPVDVFVNDRLVARGEVLVLNDNFCVRVNEIVAGVKEEGQ